MMSIISVTGVQNNLNGLCWELRHELGVTKGSEVATVVENGGRVGHELCPLIFTVGQACGQGLSLGSGDATAEHKL